MYSQTGIVGSFGVHEYLVWSNESPNYYGGNQVRTAVGSFRYTLRVGSKSTRLAGESRLLYS